MKSMAVVLLATYVFLGCGSDQSADPPPAAGTGAEAATAEKGLEAVGKRKCKDCHGANMAGQVAALSGQPSGVELYPPNLTPDVETGLSDPAHPGSNPTRKPFTDPLLARAIRQGYDEDDEELCPQMKHYPDMDDFEVYSIVKYLRSLPPVRQKILRSVCPPLKTKAQQQGP